MSSQNIDSIEEGCSYLDGLFLSKDTLINGIYSLEDLNKQGKSGNYCPYYFVSLHIEKANLIICNYSHIFDPDNSAKLMKDITDGSIVMLSDSHDLDEILLEFESSKINKNTMELAIRSLERINRKIKDIKNLNENAYKDEYNKLLKGFERKELDNHNDKERFIQSNKQNKVNGNSKFMSSNMMDIEYDMKHSEKIEEEDERKEIMKIPGNIRKPEHFIIYLKKFIYFVKNTPEFKYISESKPKITKIENFLADYYKESRVFNELDTLPFAFYKRRLRSLLEFVPLEVDGEIIHEILALQNICQFCYKLIKNMSNYSLILEPYPDTSPDNLNPTLILACIDPSEILKDFLKNTKSIILSSECLIQSDVYADILGLNQNANGRLIFSTIDNLKSLDKVHRITSLIVNRGIDQMDISTESIKLNDAGIIRNVGHMLGDLAAVTPDAIIFFFPSYQYMKDVILHWNGIDILDDILKYKLIFIESRNAEETSVTLAAFKLACERGRGAVLFALARGKIQESIELPKGSGRTIVMFGVPLISNNSRAFLLRTKHVKERINKTNFNENELIIFDALRKTASTISEFFTSQYDYGMVILADRRYSNLEKVNKLPKWIFTSMDEKNKKGISSDTVRAKASLFYK